MVARGQQEVGRPTVAVTMLKEGTQPTIDGKVDDEVWNSAAPFSTFIQQEPDEGQPASERTEVRFLADDKNLFISVIAFDREPDRIVVTQSRRDADLNDTDSVQILLDTLDDGLNAFVFGTNPFGIEYDGQVMNEGQTSGSSQTGGGGSGRSGGGGSQRGQVSGFNANWDADWTVRAGITARGWEAEFAIPLKSLRFRPGTNQTWGLNVMRNIRRRNEQVFLSLVPRGYNIYRVSVAGKLTGLTLPNRRQLQVIPYALGSVSDNKTLASKQVQNDKKIGFDTKIGVTSTLTLDATVNTDFAQVEADEQQVNLTRFALFFPEKRPFFLENAQTFQLGQPQAIDLFFSRNIGIGPNGEPIPIRGGARLSGKAGHYNVGVLNMQTGSLEDRQTGAAIAPSNNFTVARVQREIGRSNVGAMFVNRQGSGRYAAGDDYNRAYGIDAAWQATPNGKLFTFLSRTDSPSIKGGSDYAGRAFYSYANAFWSASGGYAQVGDHFNPEVGFVSRKGYRSISNRAMITYDPECCNFIRRLSPHYSYNAFFDLDGKLSTANGHWHFFEVMQSDGGRFGVSWNNDWDNPRTPFRLYRDTTGRSVVVPPGDYSWHQVRLEFNTDQSAPTWFDVRVPFGTYYTDGHYLGWDTTVGLRVGARFITTVGWSRDRVKLPYGNFTSDLVPMKVGFSFTNFANLEGLLQYNSQASTFSSNIRFALLNRSGTGLFIVYNNQQDTSRVTPATILGQSFIVKMSRLFDF